MLRDGDAERAPNDQTVRLFWLGVENNVKDATYANQPAGSLFDLAIPIFIL